MSQVRPGQLWMRRQTAYAYETADGERIEPGHLVLIINAQVPDNQGFHQVLVLSNTSVMQLDFHPGTRWWDLQQNADIRRT